jgi:intracellular sulfur oxidation DsrE/DsrF family protein
MALNRWLAAALFLLVLGPAHASNTKLPPPSAPVISDAYGFVAVPGAAVAPDRAHVFKAIFDGRQPAAKPGDILPAIMMAGGELNTLAASGVPRDHAQFVIVFHTLDADAGVLDNAHYRQKYGVDNPNLKMLAALRKAGVKLFVCAQQLLGDGVPLGAVSPDVKVAEDGLVVLMTYQNAGYALLSF